MKTPHFLFSTRKRRAGLERDIFWWIFWRCVSMYFSTNQCGCPPQWFRSIPFNLNTQHITSVHDCVPSLPLQWSDDYSLPAVGRFPMQTSLQRKEALYMEAIRLFDEGKSWECGIPLCKELAKLYEADLFDYQKLASILVSCQWCWSSYK